MPIFLSEIFIKNTTLDKIKMKKRSLERKVYDPWNLLSKRLGSKHCDGRKAKIVMYDHTGAILAECDCGRYYWHNLGDKK